MKKIVRKQVLKLSADTLVYYLQQGYEMSTLMFPIYV